MAPAPGGVQAFEEDSPAGLLAESEDDPLDDESGESQPVPASRYFELNELNSNCPGVVDYHGQEPAKNFRAEVCGYVLSNAAHLKLKLRYPPRSSAFHEFVKKHKVGDVIKVRALDVCDFPLAGAAVLRVVETVSRLEILMHPEDLSHANLLEIVKLVPAGAEFPVTIASIDSTSRTARVDTHAQAERVLEPLAAKAGVQEATVLGVGANKILFLLKCSQPAQGIFVAALRSTNARQEAPSGSSAGGCWEVAIEYQLGRQNHLSFLSPATPTNCRFSELACNPVGNLIDLSLPIPIGLVEELPL